MAQAPNDPTHDNMQPVLLSLNDNWRGTSDAHARRRIQNRVNQRARRSRHRNETQASTRAATTAVNVTQWDSTQALISLVRAASAGQVDVRKVVDGICVLDPQSRKTTTLIQAFEAFIYRNWLANAPRPELLPSLTQFNFAKALISNASILNLTSSQQFDDEAISNFNLGGPPRSSTMDASALPAGLQPTELQCHTLHHPWLDLIPMSEMRDNLFRRGVENFDDYELCKTMSGRGDGSNAGFLVWGDPWDTFGWEVTEEFARSTWAWTIVGCSNLCRSTNQWRVRRGELPLFYNLQ